jgi:hypothetical protein
MRNITLPLLLTCSSALTTLAAKPNSYPTVSLKVTVNTSQQFDPLSGTATAVVPDSGGQYIDGQNGVCASFNSLGDLIVDFDCNNVSLPRQLGLNFPAPLAPPTGGTDVCTPPIAISPSNPPHTNHLGTSKATDKLTAAFQAMANYDGTASTTYYIQIFIATQLSDTSQTAYRLNYHGTFWSMFPDAALASYAQVRRMSNTQWVVEPVTQSGLTGIGNPPNVAMLVWETSTKHTSTTTECGFYQVPFSFTLDQK